MLELRVDTDLRQELPQEIGFNFEELKSELAERLDHYNGLVVTEDGIKDAKADRAKLNKLRTAIDTRRKDIKREYIKPYTEFEVKCKELIALIDQPILAIDTQLEDYENRRKEAKMEKIREAYAETIPENLREIIPLSRIGDKKWLNSTTSMKSITEDLQAWEKRVSADLLALDTIEEEYKAAVQEKYIATLDISAAIAHKDALIKAQEAYRAREEERKAREAERVAQEEARKAAAAEQATQPEKAPETATQAPQEQAAEKTYELTLAFTVTMDQAKALREFIDANGITYRKVN